MDIKSQEHGLTISSSIRGCETLVVGGRGLDSTRDCPGNLPGSSKP